MQHQIHVVPGEGGWVVEASHEHVLATCATQVEATHKAREQLRSQGGGELFVHSRRGVIEKRDTVPGPAAHDPRDVPG